MDQTATGHFVISGKLALALIAGIPILATIGVWALAKLTATTETIKARISDEVWDRQMRWTTKRDSYIQQWKLSE
jgi:hypothetical protein